MSDYHILDADAWGNSLHVVMHFPVPAGDNAVGVAWRTVQAAFWNNGTSSVPTIDPAEQAALEAGELYEHNYVLRSHPAENVAAKRARLDAAFAEEQVRILGRLANRFEYWGYERDVP